MTSTEHDEQRLVLTVPTLVVASFSLIGSVYVCLSAWFQRRYSRISRNVLSRSIIVTHAVFWMAFCDIMINIWVILCWAPGVFEKMHLYGDGVCDLIGIFGQFFLVASVCWYAVIALCIWKLITHRNSQQSHGSYSMVNQRRQNSTERSSTNSLLKAGRSNSITAALQYITLWGCFITIALSVLATIIPFFEGGYGYVNKGKSVDQKLECWVANSYYQFIVYVIVVVYMIATVLMFVTTLRKVLTIRHPKKRMLICRLISFSIVFVGAWILPTVVRLYPFIANSDNPPLWLVSAHHISLGFIGMGNAMIWMSSDNFQGCCASFRMLRDAQYAAAYTGRTDIVNQHMLPSTLHLMGAHQSHEFTATQVSRKGTASRMFSIDAMPSLRAMLMGSKQMLHDSAPAVIIHDVQNKKRERSIDEDESSDDEDEIELGQRGARGTMDAPLYQPPNHYHLRVDDDDDDDSRRITYSDVCTIDSSVPTEAVLPL